MTDKLATLVKAAVKVVARSQFRPELAAVRIDAATITASDGIRLVEFQRPRIDEHATHTWPRLLPARKISELVTGDATLAFDPDHTRVATGRFTFALPHVEAHYPDYERCMPSREQIDAAPGLLLDVTLLHGLLSSHKTAGVESVTVQLLKTRAYLSAPGVRAVLMMRTR